MCCGIRSCIVYCISYCRAERKVLGTMSLFAAVLQYLQITSSDVINIIAHIVTVGLIIATALWLDRKRVQIGRDNELTDWIRAARYERSSKEHSVLSKSTAHDAKIFLPAHEIRRLVLEGNHREVAKDYVVFLSRRCRDLASDKKGVNAIAEELYDEVKVKC